MIILDIVIVLVFLILLFKGVAKLTRGKGAGDVGEHSVAKQLRRLPKKEYFVINDLLIRRKNGHTTQIDHIVVSSYGVFVIETKNISGHIYGSEYSPKWTRHWHGFAKGGYYKSNELTFDNPVLQNGVHVKALYEVLQRYNVRLIPIIAFSPEAVLKVNVQSVAVVYWPQITKEIKKYTEPCIPIEQAEIIYSFLLALNIKDKDSRKQHAIEVQNNKAEYLQNKNNPASYSITYNHRPLEGKESDEVWDELNRMYNNQ